MTVKGSLAISTSVSLKYLKYDLELGVVVVSPAFRRRGGGNSNLCMTYLLTFLSSYSTGTSCLRASET